MVNGCWKLQARWPGEMLQGHREHNWVNCLEVTAADRPTGVQNWEIDCLNLCKNSLQLGRLNSRSLTTERLYKQQQQKPTNGTDYWCTSLRKGWRSPVASSVSFLLMGRVHTNSNDYLRKLKTLHSVSVLHFYFSDSSFSESYHRNQRCVIGIIVTMTITAKIDECLLCCRHYANSVHAFPHLILTQLWRGYYFPHFTEEELDGERNLPSWLRISKAGHLIQDGFKTCIFLCYAKLPKFKWFLPVM